jgi:uncharacterized protein YbjT (DUF2867 family)
MADRKTVLVTGATGAQGGSVARHLLEGNGFTIRCLTRNPNSDKAQALAAIGADVIQGDLDDRSSLDTALAGCEGVFGVTNFWEHFDREAQHGKHLIDAVADSNVSHLVLSTLPDAYDLSGQKLEVPHFDIKARLERYARGKDIGATFVHVAFYYENFLSFFPPQKQEDGSYAFGFPQGDTRLAAVAVEDVGGVVTPIFKDPAKFRGRVVGIVGDDRPPAEYAKLMSDALGKQIVYNYIPRETFATFEFPGAEDLANMFEFNRLYIPNRRADLDECRALYPAMQPFDKWVSANWARLDAVLA